MAISEKKKASNQRWDKENMSNICLKLRNSEKEKIRAYAAGRGMAMQAYIMQLVREDMAKNGNDQTQQ